MKVVGYLIKSEGKYLCRCGAKTVEIDNHKCILSFADRADADKYARGLIFPHEVVGVAVSEVSLRKGEGLH